MKKIKNILKRLLTEETDNKTQIPWLINRGHIPDSMQSTYVQENGSVHTQKLLPLNEFSCGHIHSLFKFAGRCYLCPPNKTYCHLCLAQCISCGILLCNLHQIHYKDENKEMVLCLKCFEEFQSNKFIASSLSFLGKLMLLPFRLMMYPFKEIDDGKI